MQKADSLYDGKCIESFLYDMGEVAYCLALETGKIRWFSKECESFTVSNEVYDVESFYKYLNPQDIPKRKAFFHGLLNADIGEKYDVNYHFKMDDGDFVDINEVGTVILGESGERLLYGRLRKRLANTSYEIDELTGMYSRQWFVNALQNQIDKDIDDGHISGHVLAVGIDRLTMYNEAFDAYVTDEIVRGVADRLRLMFKDCGFIARVSGDTFGVSLFGNHVEQVSSIVSQLLTSFRSFPIDISEGSVFVTISIGGVSYKGDSNKTVGEPKNLIVRAESALQDAKQGGRGRYMAYKVNHKQKEEYRNWLKTSDELLTALGGNRLVLAFQPVISAKTNEVKFYECLVRMVDPTGELVAAGEFMPIIEKMGTARIVDQYIVKMAIEELKAFPELTLSINISAWTLEEPSWLRYVIKELQADPSIAERMIIEITETVALKDMETASAFVKTLHGLGARVALDDFGSGHTSFKQIRELNVDIVKIDKSFVTHMADTNDNRIFVQTLQKLADGCHVETVGEGAETVDEAKMLKKDGVTYIQGYVHGFPSVERLWLSYNHDERTPDKVKKFRDEANEIQVMA